MDLLDDVKHLIFTYCDWKQCHELCGLYGIPLILKQLRGLPTIEKVCEEKKEFVEVVMYLHVCGAPITETAVELACQNGHFNIIKY